MSITLIRRYTDEERWRGVGAWRLVYGRRKTGKSFFVRNFTEWDRYYFVLPGGKLKDIQSGEEYSYREFMRVLPYELEKGVVVDEFQRLPKSFVHELHAMGRKGSLTLVTSSKFFAHNLLEHRSPLLGLLTPFPLSLIDTQDIISQVNDIELAVFLRDPWLIGQIKRVEDIVEHLITVPALLGEVFKEEERRFTDTYEAILLGISSGNRTTKELKSYLSGKVKENVSLSSFVRVLETADLIKRVRIWGRGRTHYFLYHTSPITDIYYYLMRFGYPDISLDRGFIEEKIRERIPLYIEAFVREFFSRTFSLPEGIYIGKNGKIEEVDIVLGMRKPLVVGEVKWKERITKKEVREIERKLGRFEGARKILFVKDANSVPETELEVWDVERMVREVKERRKVIIRRYREEDRWRSS